jgi:hypothetical protein
MIDIARLGVRQIQHAEFRRKLLEPRPRSIIQNPDAQISMPDRFRPDEGTLQDRGAFVECRNEHVYRSVQQRRTLAAVGNGATVELPRHEEEHQQIAC